MIGMTDREILGLNENFTSGELKQAFRNKSKIFHPDRNNDSYKSHLAMIRLNKAYGNLLSDLDTPPEKTSVQTAEDKAYSIYKEGVVNFQKIHPSQWKKINDIFNSHAIETDGQVLPILDGLINAMAQSYYCFSLLISDYPDSCWIKDAAHKIRELEKMTIRYSKIKESYKRELNIDPIIRNR